MGDRIRRKIRSGEVDLKLVYKHKFEIESGPEINNGYKGGIERVKRRKEPRLSTKWTAKKQSETQKEWKSLEPWKVTADKSQGDVIKVKSISEGTIIQLCISSLPEQGDLCSHYLAHFIYYTTVAISCSSVVQLSNCCTIEQFYMRKTLHYEGQK